MLIEDMLDGIRLRRFGSVYDRADLWKGVLSDLDSGLHDLWKLWAVTLNFDNHGSVMIQSDGQEQYDR